MIRSLPAPFDAALAESWRDAAAAVTPVMHAVAAIACAPFPLLPRDAPFGSELLERFGDAKAHMLAWPAALLPAIAALPRHIAQFGSIWQSLFGDLDRGLERSGASSAAAATARRSLLAMLQQTVRTEQQRASMVARAISEWRTKIEDDRIALAAIRADAGQLDAFDETAVEPLEHAMRALQEALGAAALAEAGAAEGGNVVNFDRSARAPVEADHAPPRIVAVLVWVDVISGAGFSALDANESLQRDPSVIAAHQSLVAAAAASAPSVVWAALLDHSLARFADAFVESARIGLAVTAVADAWSALAVPIDELTDGGIDDEETQSALASLAAAREPMLEAVTLFAEFAETAAPVIDRDVLEFR